MANIKLTELSELTVANNQNTIFYVANLAVSPNVSHYIRLGTFTSDNAIAYVAFAHANAAFLRANTALSAGWNANISFNRANSAYNQANATFNQANTAASFANGAFTRANNEPIGTSAASFANGAFDRANSSYGFANLAYNHANSAYNFANTITVSGAFARANSAYGFANLAYNHANSAYNFANTISVSGVFANLAYNHANSAYNFANTISSSSKVTTFSAGTTGLTPSTDTSGAVTLAGTLAVANGGTGATSLAAAGITTLSGTQTITGAKTFSNIITGNISGNAGTVTNGVYTTGNQSIAGNKTFTGAFGIGTANPASGTWAGYARSLSATNPSFVMDGTTSAGSICSAYFGGAGGGDTVIFARFLYGSRLSHTVVGDIASTGTTTIYATTSDRRLKKDITPMTDGLAKTMQLKPVDYVWVVNDQPSQGFIADELQQVIPEAVTGKPDELNPNGTPKYQGIDTSYIVATLTSAIQQQQAIIEDLKNRVSILEAK